MATRKEVIEPRTHESKRVYRSWIRRIGTSTYRFNVMTQENGEWWIHVDRSLWKRWESVHKWGNE